MVCSKCHQDGHNARTCSSATPASAPSPVAPSSTSSPVSTSTSSPVSTSTSSPVSTSTSSPAPVHSPIPVSDSSSPVRRIVKRPVVAKPPSTEAPSTEAVPTKREEKIKEIVDAVQRHPLDTNWKELAHIFDCTETYLRTLYNDTVPPMDHVRICIKSMTDTVIQDLLQTTGFECTGCHRHLYSVPRQWEDRTYCDECHVDTFRDQITDRWAHVNHYAKTTDKDRCNICGVLATYNKEMGNRFHFDHLNMFEKSDSICVMVQTGRLLEEIYKEIDQCQVLCVSCHRLVTELERRSGFMRLKNNMTRDYKKTEDNEQLQKEKEENMRAYSEFMTNIYSLLRQNLHRQSLPLLPLPLADAIYTDADEQ